MNDYGDPVRSGSEEYNFEGIRDTFNAMFAAQAGIPTTDVRILIIAGLINTTPRIDDKIRIRGMDGTQKWHQVRAVLTVDPANAHYVLQCFEIVEPEDDDDFEPSLDFQFAANSQYVGQLV